MAEWTAEEDKLIKAGLEATPKRSFEDMARELARTPSAVQVRVFSLGLAQQQQQQPQPQPSALNGTASPEAAPKRRGRPPKGAAAPAPAGGIIPAPAKRGRPPKAKEVAAEAAPKKRGGRPPKAAVAPAPAPKAPRTPRIPRVAKVDAITAAPESVAPPVPSVPSVPAPASAPELPRRARKSAAPSFAISMGSHSVVAEGAKVELIEGGGLRLRFGEGLVELRGASA